MTKTVAFALCGSFCCFDTVLARLPELTAQGFSLLPVMSAHAAGTDTRFGTAGSYRQQLANLTGQPVRCTLTDTEPLGPRRLADALLIAPCTGNTLGKLALGITDTPVTMAAKSMLRVGLPVVIALSTNDGLAASFQNIGRLMNTKNIYFVPFRQDDPAAKPSGLQAEFGLMGRALTAALEGRQLQPVVLGAVGG